MFIFHDSKEVTEQLVAACRPALKIAREERRENERSDGSQTDGRETHLPVSPSAEEQEGQISALITHTITVTRTDVDYKPACLSQEVLPYVMI